MKKGDNACKDWYEFLREQHFENKGYVRIWVVNTSLQSKNIFWHKSILLYNCHSEKVYKKHCWSMGS